MKNYSVTSSLVMGYIEQEKSIYMPKDIVQIILKFYEIPLFDSHIIQNPSEKISFIHLLSQKLCMDEIKLIYNSLLDGAGYRHFARSCHDHPNNLTLIQTPYGHIFGGYTAIPWTNQSDNVHDDMVFLFMFNPITETFMMPCAVHRSSGIFGPWFGMDGLIIYTKNSILGPCCRIEYEPILRHLVEYMYKSYIPIHQYEVFQIS